MTMNRSATTIMEKSFLEKVVSSLDFSTSYLNELNSYSPITEPMPNLTHTLR